VDSVENLLITELQGLIHISGGCMGSDQLIGYVAYVVAIVAFGIGVLAQLESFLVLFARKAQEL
jgi:hypothetical protein